jgi:hypothetical protein
MTSTHRILALLMLSSMLSACQTAGNGRAFSTECTALSQQLKPGQTTQAEVKLQFGEASVYRFANGFEAWTYQQTLGVPKFVSYVPVVGLLTPALPDRTEELALLFDTTGVLRKIDQRAAQAKP